MTDAEKLRELADWFEKPDDEINITWQEAPDILRRIADLLDAVPPETLVALKAGTWKAVPVKRTDEMWGAMPASAGQDQSRVGP